MLRQIINNFRQILLISPWFNRVIRISLGIIFVSAGFTKLFNPKAFARSISEYDLIPESLLPIVAIGLPALETLAGVGLIFNIAGSLTMIFSMLIMFVIILWYGILNDLNIDCGCFSQEELKGQASLWNAFYRDIVMIVSVIFLYVSKWFTVQGSSGQSVWSKIKKII